MSVREKLSQLLRRKGTESSEEFSSKEQRQHERESEVEIFFCSELMSFRFTVFLQAIIRSFYTHY